jgi:hypothetical protein
MAFSDPSRDLLPANDADPKVFLFFLKNSAPIDDTSFTFAAR